MLKGIQKLYQIDHNRNDSLNCATLDPRLKINTYEKTTKDTSGTIRVRTNLVTDLQCTPVIEYSIELIVTPPQTR